MLLVTKTKRIMFIFTCFLWVFPFFEFILNDLISKTTELVPSEYCVIQKDVSFSRALSTSYYTWARLRWDTRMCDILGRRGEGGSIRSRTNFKFSKNLLQNGHFKEKNSDI